MDLYEKYDLTRVINGCGKMTHLAGAAVLPEIVPQVTAALPCFFDLQELHERAGQLIARAFGAEWGCVTACSGAGIALGVAACMTGKDLGKIGQLPNAAGMANEVVIQKGHAVNFGAPVTQMARLAGARVVEVGTVNRASEYQLQHALNENTAAVLVVVSHHTVRYGCIPLEKVVALAHERGVPVVVDGAAQSFQLAKIVAAGADLVVCSGHKYLSGTTAGIVCGRRDLVEAVLAQNQGIGRPMKVGKEGIFGVLAALEHRMGLDVAAWEAEQDGKMRRIIERLQDLPGVRMGVEPDANGNPFSRARMDVDPGVSGLNAQVLAGALAAGDPSIVLRAHHTDEGYVMIDAMEMDAAQVELTCDRLEELLRASAQVKEELLARYGGGENVSPQLAWLGQLGGEDRRITGV